MVEIGARVYHIHRATIRHAHTHADTHQQVFHRPAHRPTSVHIPSISRPKLLQNLSTPAQTHTQTLTLSHSGCVYRGPASAQRHRRGHRLHDGDRIPRPLGRPNVRHKVRTFRPWFSVLFTHSLVPFSPSRAALSARNVYVHMRAPRKLRNLRAVRLITNITAHLLWVRACRFGVTRMQRMDSQDLGQTQHFVVSPLPTDASADCHPPMLRRPRRC